MARQSQVQVPAQEPVSTVQANSASYDALVNAFAVAGKVEGLMEKAKKARDGYYVSVLSAAAICATLAEWEATADLLKYNITHNVDGLAKRVHAEPRKEATQDGAKFTMPRSITNAMSVIQFAFETNTPILVPNEKKEGKPIEPVSFGSLRKARTAYIDKQKVEKAKLLTGVAKTQHEIGVMIETVRKAVNTDLPEATLQGLHSGLRRLISTLTAKPQKSGGKSGDVGADLADAA